MAKVINPLFSEDASGNFAKRFVFRRGGVVTRYHVPKDPQSPLQLDHREQFRKYWMAALTQAQADLLYAVISHRHDDLYSALGHGHDHGALTGLGDDDHAQYINETRGDARYSLVAHVHDHGALTGLGDDDHAQYLTAARGDVRYPVKDANGMISIGANYQLNDDTAVAFVPPVGYGLLAVFSWNHAAASAYYYFGFYRVTTNIFLRDISKGANVATDTGALNGTTGTDGKFTVSVHTNGKIYLENRRGLGATWRVKIL